MCAMMARVQGERTEAAESGAMDEIVATTGDAQMAEKWLEAEGGPNLPEEMQLQRWASVENGRRRKRKVAPSTNMELHPLWALPSKWHAVCATN